MGICLPRRDNHIVLAEALNSSQANYNWDGVYNAGNDSKQTVDVVQFSTNHGVSLTCTEMCRSGSETGRHAIFPALGSILRAQHQARIGSCGVVPNLATLRLRSAKQRRI